MTQPPFVMRNDGQDDARIEFYNLRESALAFGMRRDEFNRLAALAVVEQTPAGWVKAGQRVHRAAMDAWKRDEDARREERIRRRRENAQSMRDEAERRAKKFRQMDEAAAARSRKAA